MDSIPPPPEGYASWIEVWDDMNESSFNSKYTFAVYGFDDWQIEKYAFHELNQARPTEQDIEILAESLDYDQSTEKFEPVANVMRKITKTVRKD